MEDRAILVKEGRTPVLSAEEARGLLDGIDLSTLAGLRDRALIGVLVFSFARVSAAVSMRVADYYTQGKRSFFRLHEKGERYNVEPAHHLAQEYVDAYLEAAELGEDRKGALFRNCAVGRQDRLEDRAMSRATALRMIKRRVRQARLSAEISAHSFRGTGITDYLRNGGDLEVRKARHGSLATGDGQAAVAPLPTIAVTLGHANLQSTAVYSAVAGLEARDFLARMWAHEPNSASFGA